MAGRNEKKDSNCVGWNHHRLHCFLLLLSTSTTCNHCERSRLFLFNTFLHIFLPPRVLAPLAGSCPLIISFCSTSQCAMCWISTFYLMTSSFGCLHPLCRLSHFIQYRDTQHELLWQRRRTSIILLHSALY